MSGRLTQFAVRTLDRLSSKRATGRAATGIRGEEEAYFHLRRLGYVMVARNYRSSQRRGEIDLIGWDGDVLCFIEVKSRGSRDVAPAEAAVGEAKRREVSAVARDYLRRLGTRRSSKPHQVKCRFDVVSIYYDDRGQSEEITLFKSAFGMG